MSETETALVVVFTLRGNHVGRVEGDLTQLPIRLQYPLDLSFHKIPAQQSVATPDLGVMLLPLDPTAVPGIPPVKEMIIYEPLYCWEIPKGSELGKLYEQASATTRTGLSLATPADLANLPPTKGRRH